MRLTYNILTRERCEHNCAHAQKGKTPQKTIEFNVFSPRFSHYISF